MGLFEVTCVSYNSDIGTMRIEASSLKEAIDEMLTYPAVSKVTKCRKIK